MNILLLLSLITVSLGVGESTSLASGKGIKINYTYWTSLEPSGMERIEVIVPPGSNFFEVMQKAAASNPKFVFESTIHPEYGHFITSIGGNAQDSNHDIYWMIYLLPNKPSQSNPPNGDLLSPVGVDSLIVNENEFYLFWLKHVPPQKL